MPPRTPLLLTAALVSTLASFACVATTAGLGDAEEGSAGETGLVGDDESSADAGSSADTDSSETGGAEAEGSTGDPSSGETTGDDGPACGDGLVDPGEDCDGEALGGADCAALGFKAGSLVCAGDCSFDTSACVDQICGDGVVEGDEACDGEALGGADCPSLGFGKGAVVCSDACEYDTSVCPPPGEGEDCGWGDECPFDYLSCVGGTCYDGSLGDPCDFDWDCDPNLACKGLLERTCQP